MAKTVNSRNMCLPFLQDARDTCSPYKKRPWFHYSIVEKFARQVSGKIEARGPCAGKHRASVAVGRSARADASTPLFKVRIGAPSRQVLSSPPLARVTPPYTPSRAVTCPQQLFSLGRLVRCFLRTSRSSPDALNTWTWPLKDAHRSRGGLKCQLGWPLLETLPIRQGDDEEVASVYSELQTGMKPED